MEPLTAPPAQTAAGQRILSAAAELFYEHGIHAVGVDTIAEAAGTTKKTIYDRYGSKDTLVAAYLLDRARRWQLHLMATCARRRPGVRRALGAFDALETWVAGSTRGCAFINAYAEYGDRTGHPAIEVVRAEKQWMLAFFVEQLRGAGAGAGAGAGRAEAERLGRVVHLLYEGALVTYTAGGDPAAVGAARRAVAALLEGAGTVA